MTIILCVGGVVIALAAYVMLPKLWQGKPKPAQKWEKAQIMKQLLELSDRENNVSVVTTSGKPRALPKNQARQPGKPAQNSRGKMAQAARTGK